jgi:hypothetical protein
MMTELKPLLKVCPACGKETNLFQEFVGNGGTIFFICNECKTQGLLYFDKEVGEDE